MKRPRELPDELKFLANRMAEQKRSDASMEGKLCVVTGATSGVGREAAMALARGGAGVVAVCRDRAKADALIAELSVQGGSGHRAVIADFSDLSQVRRAAGEILDACPRVDVLVNNAGVHSTTRRLTGAGHELAFCVNHLASFLLTELLLDRMKAKAPARIIQVNSEGHRFGGLDLSDLDWASRRYTGLKSYGASKTAQLLAVWEFAERLDGSGVTINAMHPGDVRTGIGGNNGPLYKAFTWLFVRPFLGDPARSGQAIYWMASAPELESVSGRFFHLTIEEKPAAHALDRDLGRRVWDISRRLTGLD